MQINRTYMLIDPLDSRTIPEMKKKAGCLWCRSETVEAIIGQYTTKRTTTQRGFFAEVSHGKVVFIDDLDSNHYAFSKIIAWRPCNDATDRSFTRKVKALLYLKRMKEYLERTNK